jgi:nucleoid DNA-binding protein
MSRGKNLQEMEVGTKQSKTAVNAGARAGDPMPKLAPGAVAGQSGSWEDLGGPTPDNYRPDDNSAQLKDAGSPLKQVKDVVNKGAKAADPMKGLKKTDAVKEEEEIDDEDFIEEEIDEDEEVISEGEHEKEEEEGEKEDDEEDEEEMKEEFDIEEDVNALLHGEDLSEEFQEKARVIFESALRSKVNEIREAFEVQYEEKLVEEVQTIKKELEERVDAYLEYVAEEWVNENTLSIETGLKEELTESFLGGLKQLFEEHYVEIPEEKYDVLENMVEKLDDMETKLNEQIERNIQLNKRLSESVADRIFDEISEGLASTQKEKLASLSESVEFESETQYREKLETLKESYFPSRVVAPSATTETLSEGVDVAPEYHSDTMNAYLKTLSAVAKR